MSQLAAGSRQKAEIRGQKAAGRLQLTAGSREMISDFEILGFNIQVSACMFFFLTPETLRFGVWSLRFYNASISLSFWTLT